MRTDDCSQQDRIAGCCSSSARPRVRCLGVRRRLPVAFAIAGFAIVAAAAVLALRTGKDDARLAAPVGISERGDDFLRAVVAGLPDPVVALDRDGRVLALNDRARVLAPALRKGEPLAFALRMPELIEAIGRAAAEGIEQRVVYSERVPIGRWLETIVMPVRREPSAARARFRADDVSRSDAAAPGRGNARRLRRQCQP